MTLSASPGPYEGHRVRVMWQRPVGLLQRWLRASWRKPIPIYIFIAYVRGLEMPVRICLRDEGEAPFVIGGPLDFDGGLFNHGPYADAERYDKDNPGQSLSCLFEMLHLWAVHGMDDWDAAARERLTGALDEFYSWVWREHRRDTNRSYR
jgi:hypothetical protein